MLSHAGDVKTVACARLVSRKWRRAVAGAPARVECSLPGGDAAAAQDKLERLRGVAPCAAALRLHLSPGAAPPLLAEALRALAAFHLLTRLEVRASEALELTPDDVAALAALRGLEALELVNVSAPAGLDLLPLAAGLPRLKALALVQHSKVAPLLHGDAALEAIGALSGLEELEVSGRVAQVGDAGLLALRGLTRLRRLAIGWVPWQSQVSQGAALQLLAALPRLRCLKLSGAELLLPAALSNGAIAPGGPVAPTGDIVAHAAALALEPPAMAPALPPAPTLVHGGLGNPLMMAAGGAGQQQQMPPPVLAPAPTLVHAAPLHHAPALPGPAPLHGGALPALAPAPTLVHLPLVAAMAPPPLLGGGGPSGAGGAGAESDAGADDGEGQQQDQGQQSLQPRQQRPPPLASMASAPLLGLVDAPRGPAASRSPAAARREAAHAANAQLRAAVAAALAHVPDVHLRFSGCGTGVERVLLALGPQMRAKAAGLEWSHAKLGGPLHLKLLASCANLRSLKVHLWYQDYSQAPTALQLTALTGLSRLEALAVDKRPPFQQALPVQQAAVHVPVTPAVLATLAAAWPRLEKLHLGLARSDFGGGAGANGGGAGGGGSSASLAGLARFKALRSLTLHSYDAAWTDAPCALPLDVGALPAALTKLDLLHCELRLDGGGCVVAPGVVSSAAGCSAGGASCSYTVATAAAAAGPSTSAVAAAVAAPTPPAPVVSLGSGLLRSAGTATAALPSLGGAGGAAAPAGPRGLLPPVPSVGAAARRPGRPPLKTAFTAQAPAVAALMPLAPVAEQPSPKASVGSSSSFSRGRGAADSPFASAALASGELDAAALFEAFPDAQLAASGEAAAVAAAMADAGPSTSAAAGAFGSAAAAAAAIAAADGKKARTASPFAGAMAAACHAAVDAEAGPAPDAAPTHGAAADVDAARAPAPAPAARPSAGGGRLAGQSSGGGFLSGLLPQISCPAVLKSQLSFGRRGRSSAGGAKALAGDGAGKAGRERADAAAGRYASAGGAATAGLSAAGARPAAPRAPRDGLPLLQQLHLKHCSFEGIGLEEVVTHPGVRVCHACVRVRVWALAIPLALPARVCPEAPVATRF